ncbi:MAG: hypothetical protein LBH91_05010 [Prevotellaceae bacterium]|jgi:galactokinase|nr:hypothetical protein [Prevotellaceae bacterium]
MIAQEKVEILSEILNANQERARKLVGLDANVALKEINALGHDFTLDELKEYGAMLRKTQNSYTEGEELSLDALDEVSGGGNVNLWVVSIKW